MKTKYYFILLAIAMGQFSYAQPPTDYFERYDFILGTLFNKTERIGELSPLGTNNLTKVDDRLNRRDQAVRLSSTELRSQNVMLSTTAVTLSFWINGDLPTSNGLQNIISITNGSNNNSIVSFSKSNAVSAISNGNSFTLGINSPSTPNSDHLEEININDQQWHHIAIAIDVAPSGNDDVRVYVDGAVVPGFSTGLNQDRTTLIPGLGGRLVLGKFADYNDAIDDVQFFKRALTASEISEIFNFTTFDNNARIYVDKDATGNNDGTSWANALTSLKTAMDLMEIGTTIWAADGRYTTGYADRSASFRTPNGINSLTIYGGFNGTETMLSQRDFRNNKVILSGDNNNNDSGTLINSNPFRQDNAYNVVIVATGSLTLDGLTISGGHASSTSVSDQSNGGGIRKVQSMRRLYIRNCVVENNYARGGGGGILAFFDTAQSELEVSTTVMNGNVCSFGAGLYTGMVTIGDKLDINVINNAFTNNVTTDVAPRSGFAGSAMWIRAVQSGSSVTANVVNNTIYNNTDTGTNSAAAFRSAIGLERLSGANLETLFSNNISWNNNSSQGQNVADGVAHIANTGSVGLLNMYNSLLQNAPEVNVNTLSGISMADPQFVDAPNGNLNLQSTSLGINYGRNQDIPSGNFTIDLAGNDRIANNTVDAGAFEFGSTAGLNDTAAFNFNVSPNPVKNVLRLVGEFAFAKAEIYNLQGQLIISSDVNQINVSQINPGIYFLKVQDQGGNFASRQFIKR